MQMIRGGCLCGAVRYEASGDAYNVTHCHCADCRRGTGAAFVTWASFRARDFRVTRGEMREITFAGRLRAFCPECGSALTFRSAPHADEIDVTACTFDQPEIVTPGDHIWTEDRLRWIKLADELPTHRQNRPQPLA
jgi:hypothetical protein